MTHRQKDSVPKYTDTKRFQRLAKEYLKNDDMTHDGILRVLNLRTMDLQNEIDYLRDPKVNTPSRYEGETVNEYANGLIRAYEKEIEFINKLLKA